MILLKTSPILERAGRYIEKERVKARKKEEEEEEAGMRKERELREWDEENFKCRRGQMSFSLSLSISFTRLLSIAITFDVVARQSVPHRQIVMYNVCGARLQR